MEQSTTWLENWKSPSYVDSQMKYLGVGGGSCQNTELWCSWASSLAVSMVWVWQVSWNTGKFANPRGDPGWWLLTDRCTALSTLPSQHGPQSPWHTLWQAVSAGSMALAGDSSLACLLNPLMAGNYANGWKLRKMLCVVLWLFIPWTQGAEATWPGHQHPHGFNTNWLRT